ncbi:MAG TPA: M20/M25/M40 family metallo-hydrolase [Clostridiaceae bacterium]|nr:M20/M25/M40 family metallo-hydrolase [Clostridiaceae bacterium]
MVNIKRLVDNFVNLVKIDSLSMQERQMVDALTSILEGMGLSAYEDNTGEKIGGNAGNLICTVKGSKDVPPILLMAHMDTVTPGNGKTPVIENDIIKSDGTTILGSDDAAGIVCILEALRVIKENAIEHGDIHVVFTVAEEVGLLGAKNLDYTTINAKYGFVLDDGGQIGGVAVKAPSQNIIDITIKGKASHAGIAPEKGVSAIQIAAEAISNMKLGRIDHETTANIGIIKGGQATNIVCDFVEIKAEARSRDKNKLDSQTAHMRECMEKAAEKYGGSVEFKSELEYPAFVINEDDDIIKILKKAAAAAGLELSLEETGGGSDTNIINGMGIQAVNICIGMDKVHSVNEQIKIDDMVRAVEFLVEIIKAVE